MADIAQVIDMAGKGLVGFLVKPEDESRAIMLLENAGIEVAELKLSAVAGDEEGHDG